MTDLTSKTPAEVDTLWNEATEAIRHNTSRIIGYVITDAERRAASNRSGFNPLNAGISPTEAIERLLAIVEDGGARAYVEAWDAYAAGGFKGDSPGRWRCDIGRNLEAKQYLTAMKYVEPLREALALRDGCEAEWQARGGWSRAFIVVSSKNGKVHRDWCGSWRWTTQVALVPEMSDADEATIVDYAGAGACTRCFKSAPLAEVGG